MIRIFIGYDSNEIAAYHVLAHSILKQATEPVSIAPLRRGLLHRYYDRPRDDTHSTEFSLTRFLVPSLCGYLGWAIFMDCDMMLRGDIKDLWNQRNEQFDVQVVKHDYIPSTEMKMRGAIQSRYPKKNWSSLMMFNCSRCTTLSIPYVNHASGLALHQFKWVQGEIGALSPTWNHLIGEYEYDPTAKLVHWTLGGPWWSEYADTAYAEEWFEMREEMM